MKCSRGRSSGTGAGCVGVCSLDVAELRVAIIGYGLAGRWFHGPLITATPGLEVSVVVTRDPERRAQAELDHPAARVVESVEDVWESGVDLVVVATANDSHAPLAGAAVSHAIPVVVDKPLAVSVAEGTALVERAADAGVPLTVFQNRRWDTEFLTLRTLIEEGALGVITRFESRFERWRPEADTARWRETVEPVAGGGQLIDLGAHLVDQALTLFGPVAHLYAEVEARRGTAGDDDGFIALRHASGTISHLFASAVTPAIGPRMRVQGTLAGFVVTALDPQEDALRAGERPGDPASWGLPEEWARGRLVSGEQSVPVPPVAGNWPHFYAAVRDALRDGSPMPVDPGDAVEVLRVIEAARVSAAERRVIEL